MKSVQINKLSDTFEHVRVVDAPIPEPGPGQVRVRMLLSAVNPSDLNFIRGDYYRALQRLIWNAGRETVCFDPQRLKPYPTLPYALGGEGVGIVDACGSGFLAKRLRGKRVAVPAGPPHGAWQEYTLAPARKAIALPANLSDEQAAMFVINPLSAYIMVREVLRVRKGGWLLQSAAASALGKIVIRMSKIYGFKTINVLRSGKDATALKELGADVVVESDRMDLITEVTRATNGRGVDYAMDCVGGELAEKMLQCLTLGGHMVAFGTLSNSPVTLPYRDMMMPVTRLSGFYALNWTAQQPLLKLLGVLRNVSKLSKRGVFESPVQGIFGLDDVQAALKASVAAGRSGKILLRIGER